MLSRASAFALFAARRQCAQVWQRLDKNFHTLMRSLLTIGAGLSQATEIRDLFLDITDKARPLALIVRARGCTQRVSGFRVDFAVATVADITGECTNVETPQVHVAVCMPSAMLSVACGRS